MSNLGYFSQIGGISHSEGGDKNVQIDAATNLKAIKELLPTNKLSMVKTY